MFRINYLSFFLVEARDEKHQVDSYDEVNLTALMSFHKSYTIWVMGRKQN